MAHTLPLVAPGDLVKVSGYADTWRLKFVASFRVARVAYYRAVSLDGRRQVDARLADVLPVPSQYGWPLPTCGTFGIALPASEHVWPDITTPRTAEPVRFRAKLQRMALSFGVRVTLPRLAATGGR